MEICDYFNDNNNTNTHIYGNYSGQSVLAGTPS